MFLNINSLIKHRCRTDHGRTVPMGLTLLAEVRGCAARAVPFHFSLRPYGDYSGLLSHHCKKVME